MRICSGRGSDIIYGGGGSTKVRHGVGDEQTPAPDPAHGGVAGPQTHTVIISHFPGLQHE